jgi:hypothetical protein
VRTVSGKEKFTEEQAAAIIRRAAQLQGEGRSGHKPTVDLEDLRKIAAEAGIDPSVLNIAVHEQRAGLPEKSKSGTLVRVIPGELKPDEFDIAFSRLPPNTKKAWMSQMGKTLNGYLQTSGLQVLFNIVSRNGVTRVELKSQPWLIFMYTMYPPLLLGFVLGINSLAQDWGIVPTLVSALLMVIGIPFFLWRLRVGQTKVEEMMEQICSAVEDQIALDEEPANESTPRRNLVDTQDDEFLSQNS